jgi:hypothetical protein
MKIRIAACLLLLAFTLPTAAHAQNGEVTLESVTGLWNTDTLITGQDITFSFRVNNNTAWAIKGMNNGFKISSPNGATWTASSGDTTGTLGKLEFDGGFFIVDTDVDGMVADTIGFGGFKIFGSGMVAGFNDVALEVTIGPIPHGDEGKTICLDSVKYSNTGFWKWQGPSSADSAKPDWDGPHCYDIKTDPNGVRANVNDNLPKTFALSQNYPNPFNPNTEVAFDLPVRTHVTLTVYNVLGQQVTTLVNEPLAAGSYVADWNGHSSSGTEAASGIYFYRLHTEQFTQTKKMVLLK